LARPALAWAFYDDVRVIIAVVSVAFVAVVAFLSRRGAGDRVQLRTCCSARPWPPDDLTGDARPRGADDVDVVPT
jgi:hypothetical protein